MLPNYLVALVTSYVSIEDQFLIYIKKITIHKEA